MSEILLTIAADESRAIEALDNVGSAAEDMGSEVEDQSSAFDSVGESVGNMRSPVRGLASTFRGLNSVGRGFGQIAEGDIMGGLSSMAMGVAGLVRGLTTFLIPALSATVGWLKTTKVATLAQAAVSGVVSAATKVWAGVQAVFNVIMAMNPIVLIIAGIIILIGVIVLIATKTRWFQNIWRAIWSVIGDPVKKVWSWIKETLWPGIKRVWESIVAGAEMVWEGIKRYFGFWRGVLSKVVEWVGNVIRGVRERFGNLVGFVRGLPGRIANAASGMWNGIKDAFRGAINWVIDMWNGLSFTLPSITVLGRTFGGFTLSTPDIPRLHQGIMRVPGSHGQEMLAILQAGERVTPANRAGEAPTLVIRGDGSSRAQFIMDELRHAIMQNPSFRHILKVAVSG